MRRKKIFYIGIHGLAGSGKDTVAKMLYCLLNFDKSEAKKYYKDNFNDNDNLKLISSATYRSRSALGNTDKCTCMAFADSCKRICSNIFGISLDKFYHDKENQWVCINNGFTYTDKKPYFGIITAEEFFRNREAMLHSITDIWMSLRELLVYVGTYVLQEAFGRNIFVNNVEKQLRNELCKSGSSNLEYVIFTDVRFPHEVEYIKNHNGVIINIVRKSAKQLDNIAEHELDDADYYDFTVENNGTFDDLFNLICNIVTKNIIFHNITIQLQSHDGSNNYLRQIYDKNDKQKWELCTQYGANRIAHDKGQIVMIDPAGGPMINVGDTINKKYKVNSIGLNEYNKWILVTESV